VQQVEPESESHQTVSFAVFLTMLLSPQAFELATGDYLFEPHSGEDYSRDEGIAGTSSSSLFPLTPARIKTV